MEILNQMIAAMTREEVRHLKLYLSRIETPGDRKDELLFDYARQKGKDFDEQKILKKLYGSSGKNAYYRLRNRLQQVICQNLTLLHENKSDKNKLLLYFSVYHIFSDKGNAELAFSYLLKAERLALKVENFEMLDLIYAHCIKISGDIPGMNPIPYIEKRKSNAEQLHKLREMDQVLAAMVFQLKFSQAKGREDGDTLKLLDEITQKYSADKSLQHSKVFQTKIYRAVSQILLQRHSYRELERFMISIYRKFNKARWFDKNNHDTKLQMLTFLVNSLSRNGKTAKSLECAEELGRELEAYNRLHYKKYVFYLYNARVINYSESAPQKALTALKELEEAIKGNADAYYQMFIHLNRGILYFKTGKFSDAIRSFVKYYTNDYYKSADNLFKLRVSVAEMMMHIESKDQPTTKIRLEQIQKQFKNELLQPDAISEKELLGWMKTLLKNNLKYQDNVVQKELALLVKSKILRKTEDSQLLNYSAWLQSKTRA